MRPVPASGPPRPIGLLASVVVMAGAAAAATAAPPRAELLVTRSQIVSTAPSADSVRTIPTVVYLVNRGGAAEVEVRRAAGGRDWSALQVIDGARVAMPEGVPVGPAGLGRAVQVTVLDPARRVLRRRELDLCLNRERVRLGSAGPALSAFPEDCAYHPFARGLHLGLDADYGVPIGLEGALTSGLRPGRYTVRVRIRPATAEWLGMGPRERVATLTLRVAPRPPATESPESGGGGVFGPVPPDSLPAAPEPAHRERRPRYRPVPRTAPPPGGVVPPADALPNLAALPAHYVSIGSAGRRDTLEFSATVWNAGPGALIVEGYRRGAAPRMDAFQFFRRGAEDVAAVPVGILDYDDREEHDHWHFRDFARYSLVRAGDRPAAVSPKEAWCLAPTDQIDQLVPNADPRPGDPFLATACGDATAVQVREVLEVGAGDTYGAGTPGQAIDITRLGNGVYFLKIEANPAGALRETTAGDNVALRRLVLGGRPGRRTVRVPPIEGIDTESGDARGPFSGFFSRS